MKNRKGFTLAEVLITLTIIGIVASLTIPSLVNNVQDAQYKTAWKKAYSTLTQVTQRIVADYGSLSICPYDGTYSARNCMRNAFLQYLNYTRSCDESNTNLCFHLNSDGSKYLNGDPVTGLWGNSPSAVLSDGTLLRFAVSSSYCSSSDVNCGYIYIDTNGFNAPNIIGKDIFQVLITQNTIKPNGYNVDSATVNSDCSSSGTGASCALVYLTQ
jgi:prepilin-type N-terminal cleavage/methylation domain-containing protein